MRNRRHLALVSLLVIVLAASSGCKTIAKALIGGMIDKAYESQFRDGREAGGLTRAEKRARFEEGSIRSILKEEAYSHEGRVPPMPWESP